MTGRFDGFSIQELRELKCGLGWSSSEGCAIDPNQNQSLKHEIIQALKSKGDTVESWEEV